MSYNATYREVIERRELGVRTSAYGEMPPSLPVPFLSYLEEKGVPDAFCDTELIPNIWYTNLASLKQINFPQ